MKTCVVHRWLQISTSSWALKSSKHISNKWLTYKLSYMFENYPDKSIFNSVSSTVWTLTMQDRRTQEYLLIQHRGCDPHSVVCVTKELHSVFCVFASKHRGLWIVSQIRLKEDWSTYSFFFKKKRKWRQYRDNVFWFN